MDSEEVRSYYLNMKQKSKFFSQTPADTGRQLENKHSRLDQVVKKATGDFWTVLLAASICFLVVLAGVCLTGRQTHAHAEQVRVAKDICA